MQTQVFGFDLPEDLIALRPALPRDGARMLVVGGDGAICHAFVRDLPDFLNPDDAFVVNDTRVIAARLHGRRAPRPGIGSDGPKIEVTLHRRVAAARFLAFAKPARKLAVHDKLRVGKALEPAVTARGKGGGELRFSPTGPQLDAAIATEGEVPLPSCTAGRRRPDAQGTVDYQTILANEAGSVAAPTAGLHFTPAHLSALDAKGVRRETVTLHVGAGTFLPVSGETAARLNAAHDAGARIMAVGTTSLRTLESAADDAGHLHAFHDETRLLITPGYRFKAVDVLLPNFHLPCSTLFMLVCAFAGTEVMKRAHAEAIAQKYRFYSYGDACLLFRPPAPASEC